MSALYKLVNADRTTYGGFRWPRRGFRPPRLDGVGPLCTTNWYHAYDSTLLAVLHDPIHGRFGPDAECFSIHVDADDIGRLDGQMKVGFRAGVVGETVPLPKVTTEQRVRYGIACASQVYDGLKWTRWAKGWIYSADRSASSAASAARSTFSADHTARSAANAAWGAASAAREASADLDLISLAEWAISDSLELP